MNQPDFSELFRSHFGGDPKAVIYELRSGPNMLHDLAFMSSLTHDARVVPKKLNQSDSNLFVPLERDCWELGYTEKDNSLELHIVESLLYVKACKSIKWTGVENLEEEYWIDYLWISEDYRIYEAEIFNVTLAGHDWKLIISVDKEEFLIELQDQEVPYLYSEKHKT